MKHILSKKGNCFLLAFMTGALMLTQLTACSTADDLAGGTNQNDAKGLKLIINGSLPSDNSTTRGGTLVDNSNNTGGMNFKWTESTDRLTAVCLLHDETLVEWITQGPNSGKYDSKVSVTPNKDAINKAYLEAEKNIKVPDKPTAFYAFNVIQDISDKVEPSDGQYPVTGNLTMPTDNKFIQDSNKSTSHLNNYLFMMGIGYFSFVDDTQTEISMASVDMEFKTTVATIRLKVTNKRSDDVTIKSIKIESSERLAIFPNLKVWTGSCSPGTALTEPEDISNYYNSVTVQCGDNGFEAKSGDAIYSYVAVHQHYNKSYPYIWDALNGKALDFVVTTSDGNTYTAFKFDCNNLSKKSGFIDFVAGYTYTFNLNLSDKLSLDGVTVNKWNEVEGGDIRDNVPTLSITELCTNPSYTEYREAMTTLTIDGPSITEDEITKYMQGNLATYFPKVTTINITGTELKALNNSGILSSNKSVTTVIGNNITSLPNYAFHTASSVTTYVLPNFTDTGADCFYANDQLNTISLPKLKALSNHLFYVTMLKSACFASLTDFKNMYAPFGTVENLAFGATGEFSFGGNTPADLFEIANKTTSTTLYLNEDGEEYKNHVVDNVWRDVTFKEIKKYSEYPYQKD